MRAAFHREVLFVNTVGVLIGLTALLGAPHRSLGHAYDPAKRVLLDLGLPAPMRWWGGLLVLLGMLKYVAVVTGARWWPVVSMALAIYWCFWLFIFLIYLAKGDGLGFGPGLATVMAYLHLKYFNQVLSARNDD